MIGPGGMPERMGLSPQGGVIPAEAMDMEINQFASRHPEQLEQIRQAIMQVVQSGELTPQELNTIIQLATVASRNPEIYPNVRKFAIQQGIATEQDLPPQYDQGLVFALLLAAKAIQQDIGGQDMMAGGSPSAIPSMAKGGAVPDSRKPDGSVMINAHEGEYVIPANVVKMKGREFFDNLVEKYKE
jgi:hypothetical protein